METKKKWRAYVYIEPHDELVMAETADEADKVIRDRIFSGCYGDYVTEVEVKRECEGCGYVNDEDATECEECEAKL